MGNGNVVELRETTDMSQSNSNRSVFRTHISPIITVGLLVALFMPPAIGGQVSGLTTFTNGTTANADEVNANFQAVAAAVNDNDTRITALEGAGGAPEQVIASQGIQPSQGGTVFGVYGQSGSAGFAQVLITRNGTLEGFSARASATLNAMAAGDVRLIVNGIPVGNALLFTAADTTTMKTDASVINVVAGDLVTFRMMETSNMAALGASLHASVTLK